MPKQETLSKAKSASLSYKVERTLQSRDNLDINAPFFRDYLKAQAVVHACVADYLREPIGYVKHLTEAAAWSLYSWRYENQRERFSCTFSVEMASIVVPMCRYESSSYLLDVVRDYSYSDEDLGFFKEICTLLADIGVFPVQALDQFCEDHA